LPKVSVFDVMNQTTNTYPWNIYLHSACQLKFAELKNVWPTKIKRRKARNWQWKIKQNPWKTKR